MSASPLRNAHHEAPSPVTDRYQARDKSFWMGEAMRIYEVTVKDVAFWWGTNESFVRQVLGDIKPLTDQRISQFPEWFQDAMDLERLKTRGFLFGRKAALLRCLEGLSAFVDTATDDIDPRLHVDLRMKSAELK